MIIISGTNVSGSRIITDYFKDLLKLRFLRARADALVFVLSSIHPITTAIDAVLSITQDRFALAI